MKIRVIVDKSGNLVGAGPVETAKGKDVASCVGIKPANHEDIMYEMEIEENIFQSDASHIPESIFKLLDSKKKSNELLRINWIRHI